MGVSLGYFSTTSVSPANHRLLLELVTSKNKAYDWWCESIWISERPDTLGNVFGFTKLFRLIDDADIDYYMVYLDIGEIVRFFTSVAERLGVEWRFEVADAPFGTVRVTGPDAQLEGNLSGFLEAFPGD